MPTNIFLISILKKILLLASKFKEISFLHILRGLNEQEDLEANKAAVLDRNVLAVNDRYSHCNIP